MRDKSSFVGPNSTQQVLQHKNNQAPNHCPLEQQQHLGSSALAAVARTTTTTTMVTSSSSMRQLAASSNRTSPGASSSVRGTAVANNHVVWEDFQQGDFVHGARRLQRAMDDLRLHLRTRRRRRTSTNDNSNNAGSGSEGGTNPSLAPSSSSSLLLEEQGQDETTTSSRTRNFSSASCCSIPIPLPQTPRGRTLDQQRDEEQDNAPVSLMYSKAFIMRQPKTLLCDKDDHQEQTSCVVFFNMALAWHASALEIPAATPTGSSSTQDASEDANETTSQAAASGMKKERRLKKALALYKLALSCLSLGNTRRFSSSSPGSHPQEGQQQQQASAVGFVELAVAAVQNMAHIAQLLGLREQAQVGWQTWAQQVALVRNTVPLSTRRHWEQVWLWWKFRELSLPTASTPPTTAPMA